MTELLAEPTSTRDERERGAGPIPRRDDHLGLRFIRKGDEIDLDAAATTPAMTAVADAVDELLPYYASVHRGAGWRSRVTSAAYEGARQAVLSFVGAREGDHVVFTRGTTESANLLSYCLPRGSVVISGAHEHHANLLPWARHCLRIVPLSSSPEELLASYEDKLRGARGRPTLVAVTAASNVTGEVLPVAEIAALAHSYGAKVFVDAAQLAARAPIRMSDWDIDYLAFSGHKTYAPFGAGVLAGHPQLLDRAAPYLRGGGASIDVTRDRVSWKRGPSRHEAGTPNVLGAVALGVACDVLAAVGMEAVAAHEQALAGRLRSGLATAEGVRTYRLGIGRGPTVPTVTFDLGDQDPGGTADALARRGIGVRSGRFCAHLLVDGLTDGRGAVRASMGLHSSPRDVDALAEALSDIAGGEEGAETRPDRRLDLPFRLVWQTA